METDRAETRHTQVHPALAVVVQDRLHLALHHLLLVAGRLHLALHHPLLAVEVQVEAVVDVVINKIVKLKSID